MDIPSKIEISHSFLPFVILLLLIFHYVVLIDSLELS